MTPVVYLSDAFLATGSEPWRIRQRLTSRRSPSNATKGDGPFQPYLRDPDTLTGRGRCPVPPGWSTRSAASRGRHHRQRHYDPENHHLMQTLRAAKVAGIAKDIPPLEVFGPSDGDLLILGWELLPFRSLRCGAVTAEGHSVAHGHPAPPQPVPREHRGGRAEHRKVLIPEVNLGQLLMLIRARFLVDAVGYGQRARQAVPDRRDRRRGGADAQGLE